MRRPIVRIFVDTLGLLTTAASVSQATMLRSLAGIRPDADLLSGQRSTGGTLAGNARFDLPFDLASDRFSPRSIPSVKVILSPITPANRSSAAGELRIIFACLTASERLGWPGPFMDPGTVREVELMVGTLPPATRSSVTSCLDLRHPVGERFTIDLVSAPTAIDTRRFRHFLQ